MRLKFSIPAAALLLAACATIAPFNRPAYEKTIELKYASLSLMKRATGSYARNAADADSLRAGLDQAYAEAKSRPKNEITARQWAILKDPDQNLVGGFLKRWQAGDSLSPAFVEEESKIVSDGFDQIADLEIGKAK